MVRSTFRCIHPSFPLHMSTHTIAHASFNSAPSSAREEVSSNHHSCLLRVLTLMLFPMLTLMLMRFHVPLAHHRASWGVPSGNTSSTLFQKVRRIQTCTLSQHTTIYRSTLMLDRKEKTRSLNMKRKASLTIARRAPEARKRAVTVCSVCIHIKSTLEF
jgi:hypothetical protein